MITPDLIGSVVTVVMERMTGLNSDIFDTAFCLSKAYFFKKTMG